MSSSSDSDVEKRSNVLGSESGSESDSGSGSHASVDPVPMLKPLPTKKTEARTSVKAPPKATKSAAKAEKAQKKARGKKKAAGRTAAQKFIASHQTAIANEYTLKANALNEEDEEGTNIDVLALGVASMVIRKKLKRGSEYTSDSVDLPRSFFGDGGLLMPDTRVDYLILLVNELLQATKDKVKTTKTGETKTTAVKVLEYTIKKTGFDDESVEFSIE